MGQDSSLLREVKSELSAFRPHSARTHSFSPRLYPYLGISSLGIFFLLTQETTCGGFLVHPLHLGEVLLLTITTFLWSKVATEWAG